MHTDTPGEWFLGGPVDPETGDRTGEELNYESANLTTHGVIVGMTGSGKTGLGIVAIEEALLSGVPAIVIDPKGDMGNLLLNFPAFRPQDFREWIDPAEANRQNIAPEELAEKTAELWKSGLEGWGIDGDRMRRLGMTADFGIYTPGSTAGIPLNVVGSLQAPAIDWDIHAETGRDEIEGFVSSLLTLAGINADPIASPEHILLATIIERAWRAGTDLDLAALIGQIQQPPIRKLGVFELDSFFPPKDRTKLAMRLNGLVASPSFTSWMQGPALDIATLLHTEDGRPRASVVYLSHLGEQERQFIVTLLLSKVVTWMRSQPGTSDLRALIYMDEVFGFAPPTAEPPSKKPILTILKQARAHGVGMVLSTQNPVDLDYKAMSNAGTWMIGRLQTERDKARILEGLKSASGAVDVAALDALIGDLGKRQFVLHSTKRAEPALFTTRWAMSYLRGPLTRDEVAKLMAGASADSTSPGSEVDALDAAASPAATAGAGPVVLAENESPVAPEVAQGVPVYYLDPGAPWAEEIGASRTSSRHAPALIAKVHLTYDDRYAEVNHTEEWEAIAFPLGEHFDPDGAVAVDYDSRDLLDAAPEGATYLLTDAPISSKGFFSGAEADLKAMLHRDQSVSVFKNPELKMYSRVGESQEEFLSRCKEEGENRADDDVAKLRDRYKTKIRSVESQLSKAENRVRELSVDLEGSRSQEMLSGAGDLLSVFLGGRRRSSSLSRAASRRAQTRKTEERLRSAEDKYAESAERLDELEDELAADFREITAKWDAAAATIEQIEIGLEKTDISIDEVALVWIPSE
jgi:hypothetical protein